MEQRAINVADRIIGQIDKAIKVLSAPARAARAYPSVAAGDAPLRPEQRRESCRLMRVNHSGEVAAQALYQGQAFAARSPTIAASMMKAAAEEMDHLAWCERRLSELSGRRSALNPLWYAGSFAFGALAGALGDRASLGFIAETEKQVESHLREHMRRLPAADARSRAIIDKMTHDEIAHGAQATSLGGQSLPFPLRVLMRLTSRVMTLSSYWV